MKSVAFASLAADYVQHLRERNLAPATIQGAEVLLHQFLGWLEGVGIADIRAVTRDTLWAYGTMVLARAWAPRTKAARIARVKQVFRFLHGQGRILTDPSAVLPEAKVPDDLPRVVLTAEEMNLLLAQPDVRTPVGYRDRTILETLFATAIRSAELRKLSIYDLDFAEGVLRIRQGKGRKDRLVPMGKVAGRFLAEYVKRVRPWLAKPNGETTLFLLWSGRPIGDKMLNTVILRYVRQARLGKRVTAHTFRHTCATEMLRGGSSIRYVQELLGHADISTTQIYTRILPLDLVQAHKKSHPRERQRQLAVPGSPQDPADGGEASFFHQPGKRRRKGPGRRKGPSAEGAAGV